MASADASGIGVNNKNRFVKGKEQNCVGGFPPDAGDLQQRTSPNRAVGRPFHGGFITREEVGSKAECLQFASEKAGGPDELLQAPIRIIRQCGGFVHAGIKKCRQSPESITPGRILRQDGSGGYLPAAVRPPRPPIVRVVAMLQNVAKKTQTVS